MGWVCRYPLENGQCCDQIHHCAKYLFSHIRGHTGQKLFVCPIDGCGESYTLKGSLKTHMENHLGIKKIECYQCGKKFAKKYNYQKHLKSKRGCSSLSSR